MGFADFLASGSQSAKAWGNNTNPPSGLKSWGSCGKGGHSGKWNTTSIATGWGNDANASSGAKGWGEYGKGVSSGDWSTSSSAVGWANQAKPSSGPKGWGKVGKGGSPAAALMQNLLSVQSKGRLGI